MSRQLFFFCTGLLLLQVCAPAPQTPSPHCPLVIRDSVVWRGRGNEAVDINCDVHVYGYLNIRGGCDVHFARDCGITVHPRGTLVIDGETVPRETYTGGVTPIDLNTGLPRLTRGLVYLAPQYDSPDWKGITILSAGHNSIRNCSIEGAGGPRSDGYPRAAILLGDRPLLRKVNWGRANIDSLSNVRLEGALAPALYLQGYSDIGKGIDVYFLGCFHALASVVPNNMDQLHFKHVLVQNRNYAQLLTPAWDRINPSHAFVEIRSEETGPLPPDKTIVQWPKNSEWGGATVFYRLTGHWTVAEPHVIDSANLSPAPKITIRLDAGADLRVTHSDFSYMGLYLTDPPRQFPAIHLWNGILVRQGRLHISDTYISDHEGYLAPERPRGFLQIDAAGTVQMEETRFGSFLNGSFPLVLKAPGATINSSYRDVNHVYWSGLGYIPLRDTRWAP